MSEQFKPMLAATVEESELSTLRYPLWGTPKIDGIRTLMLGGKARSRTLKGVPNNHVRAQFEAWFAEQPDLDGEYVVPGAPFEEVSGSWRNAAGQPKFEYLIFDSPGPDEYINRLNTIDEESLPEFARVLWPEFLWGKKKVLEFEEHCLAQGFEGIILRQGDGLYKCGRSTLREQGMLKFKRSRDAEAVVVGVEELFHNNNEQVTDLLGHAKRSDHRENLVPAGVLGSLVVEGMTAFTDVRFNIGTGFTAAQRAELWQQRDSLIGMIVRFSYQPVGSTSAPRFPSFQGFRAAEDI